MKKFERIVTLVENLISGHRSEWPTAYSAYFLCFNRGEYFEAHDVLESLWLVETGPDARFYKGLIQFAGAHVHLKKQFARPDHPKDGRRLRPATRVFALAAANFAAFPDYYMGLDVAALLTYCRQQIHIIESEGFRSNPWSPGNMLRLDVDEPSKIRAGAGSP